MSAAYNNGVHGSQLVSYNGYGDPSSYHCHQSYNGAAFPVATSPTQASAAGTYSGHLQYGSATATAAAVAAAAAVSTPPVSMAYAVRNPLHDKSDT